MAEKLVRPPFTAFEKEYLKELLVPYINILESKKTNSCFNNKKNELWEKVTVEFNNCPRCTKATAKQLKKAWNNMKSRARDAKTSELQRKHTGGGPPIKDMDPEDESVLSLIPNILPKAKVVNDSDGPGYDSDADDDNIFWSHKANRKKSIEDDIIFDPIPNKPTIFQPIITTTPLTKEFVTPSLPSPISVTNNSVDPQFSQNHTSSSMTQPVTSNKTIHRKRNDNKESIEDLKKKIITDDIKFRIEKHKSEMEHMKSMHAIQKEILEFELKYKKRLLEMAEEEHQYKLKQFKY